MKISNVHNLNGDILEVISYFELRIHYQSLSFDVPIIVDIFWGNIIVFVHNIFFPFV